MKKIITTAALFAAGTALASAAITTWDEIDGTNSVSTPSVLPFGTASVTWAIDDSGLNWGNGTQESVVFTVDASSITTTNSYTLLSIKDETYNGLAGVAVKDGELVFVNWNQNTPVTSSVSWSELSPGKNLTFVLTHSSANQMELSIYEDGNFASAAKTLTGRSNFYFTTEQRPIALQELNFGASAFGASYTAPVGTVMPADADVSAYTLLGAGYAIGDISVSDLQTYYKTAVDPTAVVPEPSAFGLLAGIGALALVASRRRRK